MTENLRRTLQVERIKIEVRKKFFDLGRRCNLADLTSDDIDHVIDIGVSILLTKWEIGPEGGSFVKCVVDNDLMGAFSRADEVNTRAIHFYTMLIYNTSYID